MNGLYRVNELIKEYLSEQQDITQVIEVRDESMLDDNFWKKNLYPIALVYPGQVEWTSEILTTYTFQLMVLSQRDISDSPATRYNSNDNMIDNLNIAAESLGWVINKIRLLSYDDELDEEDIIKIDGVPSGDRITNFGQNGLDGYQVFLRLQVNNNTKYC